MFLKSSCEDAAEECIAEIMKEAENKDPEGNKNMTREEQIRFKAGELADFGIAHGALHQDEYYEGFKDGAKWADNNPQRNLPWHKCSKEIPTKFGSSILVVCKNKNKEDGIFLTDLIQCWEGKWEPRENWEDPVLWAYLDDLLPD